MKKNSKLKKIALSDDTESKHGIVKLLIADHKLMRKLMKKVKSQKASDAEKVTAFKELEKTVESHVKAEEEAFLKLVKDNPKFEDMALEGYEEHRVHETVVAGLYKVSDKKRRIEQMKIYCEILEHHLDEEEEDLFSRFKKYAAKATRKKIAANFLELRKKTNKTNSKKGAARF